jgi:hypothetical protein
VSVSHNYKGLWKGDVRTPDTTFHVEMNVLIQKGTMITAIIIKPSMYMLDDSTFYGEGLHLKSSKKEVELRNANLIKRNVKGEKLILYHEIKFSGALAVNKNQLSGELTLNGKIYQLDMFRGDKPIFRPQEPQKPYPYLNHSFQECKTGFQKEALTLELTFSPKALYEITKWILEHVEE